MAFYQVYVEFPVLKNTFDVHTIKFVHLDLTCSYQSFALHAVHWCISNFYDPFPGGPELAGYPCDPEVIDAEFVLHYVLKLHC